MLNYGFRQSSRLLGTPKFRLKKKNQSHKNPLDKHSCFIASKSDNIKLLKNWEAGMLKEKYEKEKNHMFRADIEFKKNFSQSNYGQYLENNTREPYMNGKCQQHLQSEYMQNEEK